MIGYYSNTDYNLVTTILTWKKVRFCHLTTFQDSKTGSHQACFWVIVSWSKFGVFLTCYSVAMVNQWLGNDINDASKLKCWKPVYATVTNFGSTAIRVSLECWGGELELGFELEKK